VLRTAAIGGVICALALLAQAAAYGGERDANAAALRASQAAIGRVLGDHQFTDQDGLPLRMAELRGRPLLLSLVYTHCYYICSGLTIRLRDAVRIAEETLGPGSFAVLTVGFDTRHDTPAQMRIYARERGISEPEWHFATADAATIRRLADEVGFTWAAVPGGFDHVTQVTIVDADGRVVEQVYGQDFPTPALIEPLKQLVWGRASNRTGVQGLLGRVQLLCTVYDPVAGRYRVDYSMLVGFFPGLMVLCMVAVAILALARKPR
jgi:protein SCO1/2